MNIKNTRTLLWLLPVGILGIGLFVAVLLYSRDSTATPGIAWTPTSITDTVSPGQQQTIPISFAASATIANGVLWVVPALQKLVQVIPSSLPSVQKGQTISVTLTVSPLASAPLAVTDGTIHVRVGSKTIAQPLPVTIIVASDAMGLLPPDPGAAGEATLAGIDSDNDGVRDDIERYIWLTYPQSEKTRQALFSFARAEQDALLSAGAEANALSAANNMIDAQDCLWYI